MEHCKIAYMGLRFDRVSSKYMIQSTVTLQMTIWCKYHRKAVWLVLTVKEARKPVENTSEVDKNFSNQSRSFQMLLKQPRSWRSLKDLEQSKSFQMHFN